jgi:hypothetical protein
VTRYNRCYRSKTHSRQLYAVVWATYKANQPVSNRWSSLLMNTELVSPVICNKYIFQHVLWGWIQSTCCTRKACQELPKQQSVYNTYPKVTVINTVRLTRVASTPSSWVRKHTRAVLCTIHIYMWQWEDMNPTYEDMFYMTVQQCGGWSVHAAVQKYVFSSAVPEGVTHMSTMVWE